MKHILICLAALLAGAAATAQSVDQSGVGAGGYAGASAIHSSNNMIMGLGTDMNGCMLNTSGVDDAQWTPWREGLWPDSGGLTSNVQDMIHVDYTPAFGGSNIEGWFAATVGGIFFAASDGGTWTRQTNQTYTWQNNNEVGQPQYTQQIGFCALAWNGQDKVYAATGNNIYSYTDKNGYYHSSNGWNGYGGLGLPHSLPIGFSNQYVLWYRDLDQGTWNYIPESANVGSPRDVAVYRENGVDYVALTTDLGVYLWDGTNWTTLHTIPVYKGTNGLFSNWYGYPTVSSPTQAPPTYGPQLAGWSLGFTDRGTLYMGAQSTRFPCSHPGGVYRIFDITDALMWTWVGDGTSIVAGDPSPLAPYDNNPSLADCGQMYYYNQDLGCYRPWAMFGYVSVISGSGEGPDHLVLGTRQGRIGLCLGVVPYQYLPDVGKWHLKVFKDQQGQMHEYVLDGSGNWSRQSFNDTFGWLVDVNYTGCALTHEPSLGSGTNPPFLFQFEGGCFGADFALEARGYVDYDIHNAYVEQINGSWFTRGYTEMVTLDVVFDDDGRLLYGNGDMGSFRSTDSGLTAFDRINYPNGSGPDMAPKADGINLVVRDDWRGSGEEALFVNAGFSVRTYNRTTLLMQHPSVNNGAWKDITGGTPSGDVRFSDLVLCDDNTLFAIFDDDLTSDSNRFHVCKGVYDGSIWTWSVLPYDNCAYDGQAVQLLYHASSGRVFLAQKNPAKILYLASTQSTTWVQAFSTAAHGAVSAMAHATVGDGIYAALSNPAGVVTCFNPEAAPRYIAWNTLTVPGSISSNANLGSIAVDPASHDFAVGVRYTFDDNTAWFVDYNPVLGTTSWTDLLSSTDFHDVGVNCLAFSPVQTNWLLVGTGAYEILKVTLPTSKSAPVTVAPLAGIHDLRARFEAGRGGVISFRLGAQSPVDVGVYDIRGRLVRRLRQEAIPAGDRQLVWDGRDGGGRACASGVYLVKVQTASAAGTAKLTMVR